MENEILLQNKFELKNKKLNTQFNAIIKAYNQAQKSTDAVAQAIKNIYDNELWMDDYKSFEECVGEFGIKKSQAYRLMKSFTTRERIAKEHEDSTIVEYTLSQVAELDRLETDEDIVTAIENEVQPSMTCKEIRQYVDSVKIKLPIAEEIESDGEGENETENDTEQGYTIVIGNVTYKNIPADVVESIEQMLEDAGYSCE